MLLSIATTHVPATDLGYLLHKHPERLHSFELGFGNVHVFYPVAQSDMCEAVLLLDIDPVKLVGWRRQSAGNDDRLFDYVNDRPYVASSFLSVALSEVFGTALAGNSRERPELAITPIPLRARVECVLCRGGEALVRRLFEPLGYVVTVSAHALDTTLGWDSSGYFTVQLQGTTTVRDLLNHLYVLIPVLDDQKHYWVGQDEIEKLLRRGEGWLSQHPEKDLISDRYLRHRRHLARQALERLAEAEEQPADPTEDDAPVIERGEREEEVLEAPVRLNDRRYQTVTSVLREVGAHRILDLGCGSGRFLQEAVKERTFTELVGVDAVSGALEGATRRLHLDDELPRLKGRVRLLQGALTYADDRLKGYDAATLIEVIEHLDIERLPALRRAIFQHAHPQHVVVTTPNIEYNVHWPNVGSGRLRHSDHRFEWTRLEFTSWCRETAEGCGYTVRFLPIGEEDPEVGPPTQMAVFSR